MHAAQPITHRGCGGDGSRKHRPTFSYGIGTISASILSRPAQSISCGVHQWLSGFEVRELKSCRSASVKSECRPGCAKKWGVPPAYIDTRQSQAWACLALGEGGPQTHPPTNSPLRGWYPLPKVAGQYIWGSGGGVGTQGRGRFEAHFFSLSSHTGLGFHRNASLSTEPFSGLAGQSR